MASSPSSPAWNVGSSKTRRSSSAGRSASSAVRMGTRRSISSSRAEGWRLANGLWQVLRELGAVPISEPLNRDFSDHGTLNKIFVCAHAERVLDEPTLVFLDSDTVVIGEPADLDLPPGIDIAIRPRPLDPD